MDSFLIRCYLWAPDVLWSEELTHRLLENLADFLAERGFANPDDGEMRSVIVAGEVEIPEMEQWVDELTEELGASVILTRGCPAESPPPCGELTATVAVNSHYSVGARRPSMLRFGPAKA